MWLQDADGNGEVDIWEFQSLWEYIGGDDLLQNEKREIHEWTATCERYDPSERGGLTRQVTSQAIQKIYDRTFLSEIDCL